MFVRLIDSRVFARFRAMIIRIWEMKFYPKIRPHIWQPAMDEWQEDVRSTLKDMFDLDAKSIKSLTLLTDDEGKVSHAH